MGSEGRNEYLPDTVSPPGDTLQETLDFVGMTQRDLAQRIDRSPKFVNEVVKGKAPITPETALQLERVLGVPASFWGNRERHYRESLARAEERAALREHVEWLKRLPVADMVKQGWIRGMQDRVDQLVEVLRFFGVSSPAGWDGVWKPWVAVFRRSRAFESDPYAVAAWLRRGEIAAQETKCRPFDRKGWLAALWQIRSLTVKSPKVFQPEMKRLCAEVGVAVVFVPQVGKTRAYGGTRWLTSEKAVIQLSLRGKANDLLWFTFFHEAAHLLFHRKRETYIEGDGRHDEEEKAADVFAANILIATEKLGLFVAQHRRVSLAAVKSFAHSLGIAPGIVVGRLQHEGVLNYSQGNRLKRKLVWAED